MRLTHSCIVTEDVPRLREFYVRVLRLAPQDYGDEYVEFPTERGTLAIFARGAQERLAPGSTKVSSNRSMLLEFEVDDVDAEYKRLESLDVECVKPPTTQPWGNRSIYFRDPDGDLVNFYTRVARS